MDGPLVGGHIQRVALSAVGGREVALLKVRVPPPPGTFHGENVHIVLASGMGVGIVDAEGLGTLRDALCGATASSQARWRSTIVGGRIVGVQERGLVLVCDGRIWRIEGARALQLVEQTMTYPEAAEIPREELAVRGAKIVERLLAAGVGGRREALRRGLLRAIARLDRRIEAVRGDVARTDGADADAGRARLFVSQASHASRGATKLVATDWSSGEAKDIEMVLDPSRNAREQIDAVFKRARRLKEGVKISLARLSDAHKTRDALSALAQGLAVNEAGGAASGSQGEGRKTVDLDAIETQARAAAPRDFRLPSSDVVSAGPGARDQAPHPPYRTFLGASGARILVGRGAVHNDTLTFRVAKPHDLWLHAKNHAGAHVIVPRNKGASCPADVLVEAAHLAAHFSDARDEGIVEVQYAPRRHVRKPRGSAPGLVVVDREKVIVLRRQAAVTQRLLERETAPSSG